MLFQHLQHKLTIKGMTEHQQAPRVEVMAPTGITVGDGQPALQVVLATVMVPAIPLVLNKLLCPNTCLLLTPARALGLLQDRAPAQCSVQYRALGLSIRPVPLIPKS